VNITADPPECVCPLMPAQLSTYAVRDRCHKLTTKSELSAKSGCKLLWAVVLLGHVPLKLVGKRDVTNVNVQLIIQHQQPNTQLKTLYANTICHQSCRSATLTNCGWCGKRIKTPDAVESSCRPFSFIYCGNKIQNYFMKSV